MSELFTSPIVHWLSKKNKINHPYRRHFCRTVADLSFMYYWQKTNKNKTYLFFVNFLSALILSHISSSRPLVSKVFTIRAQRLTGHTQHFLGYWDMGNMSSDMNMIWTLFVCIILYNIDIISFDSFVRIVSIRLLRYIPDIPRSWAPLRNLLMLGSKPAGNKKDDRKAVERRYEAQAKVAKSQQSTKTLWKTHPHSSSH